MNEINHSEKKILLTFVLCLFLGGFGIHRFYLGKYKTGILQLLTLGGLGIWALFDAIMLVLKKFKDSEDRTLVDWT